MTKKLELTRRRVLGGLGTIGVASVAAGLGTSAYLNDTESFQDNSITAGTLDMSVQAQVVAADDYHDDAGEWVGESSTANGEPAVGINVDDVKPGDWAIICFDIDVGDNPGYVQVMTENLSSSENEYTEPEPDTGNSTNMTGDFNDPGNATGAGELQDKILATIWSGIVSGDSDGMPDERADLMGLDDTTNVAGGSKPNHSWDSSRTEGGEVSETIHYSTLQEAYDEYSTGVTIRNSDESAVEFGSDDGFNPEFCLLLEIPTEVGNEIQGDSLSFDLVFTAIQSRHVPSDEPFNGTLNSST